MRWLSNRNKKMDNHKEADICLLLEGTYPYVRGGVSSWVHQIISGLPEYTFYLIFIGGEKGAYTKRAYELPDNVVGIDMYFLFPERIKSKPMSCNGDLSSFQTWQSLLKYFNHPNDPIPGELLHDFAIEVGNNKEKSFNDFLYSRASWYVLTERYLDSASYQSFVDYFWTYRGIYQPLITLAQVSQQLPKAKIYHSISTGYAGFLGALCQKATNKPFLLTEHGIYTKERKIDLSQAAWIKDQADVLDMSMYKSMDYVRQVWVDFFEQLGLTAYTHAQEVVALFEGNRHRQIIDGAPEHKTQVIVNGINIERFKKAYEQRPLTPPHVVGLIGRVVPIKDVKTFIRTIRAAISEFPRLEGWIIGPLEEDPDYVNECTMLIESLGMQDQVKLLGNQNVAEIMPKLGSMMLTSISEAQPLVLLEAMAAGIPCIATDVGACREIIEGRSGEDTELGKSGEVISIASPTDGAKAISLVLSHAERWQQAGDIGRQRVIKYYDESMMYEAYRQLYQGAINGGNRI